ncbi:MAG: phosphatase PAP2 family protein [Azospirillaceae bacterium]
MPGAISADPQPPLPVPMRVVWMLVWATVASAAVFLIAPEIDLWLSGLFHTAEERFWFRTSTTGAIYDDIRNWVLMAPPVAYIAWRLVLDRRPVARLTTALRETAFVLLALLVSNGLVVNAIFKEQWGRARPHQTEPFGGADPFVPPLVPSDACASNCSFVGGDMGFAFGMIALVLLARRARKAWLVVAMIFGLVISAFRVIAGAHFTSDGVFALLFTALVTIALFKLLLEPGPAAVARRRRLGLDRIDRAFVAGLERLAGATATAVASTNRAWRRAIGIAPGTGDTADPTRAAAPGRAHPQPGE